MRVFYILITLILFNNFLAKSQEKKFWNNHKCAVALTYDDGLDVHLDKVMPALEARGFMGTFYVPCNSESLEKRLDEWRKSASKGHELGNHTIYHPCIGKISGREWVRPDNDLNYYSIDKIVSEIRIANTMLRAIDGKNRRTFAYTCGDMAIRDTSFVKLIENDFVGARGVSLKFESFNNIDFMNVGAYVVNEQKADELIEAIKKARDTGSLLVFLFHGVGGGHSINFDENEHAKFLDFLKQNEKDIWVAPLVDILDFVKNKQK